MRIAYVNSICRRFDAISNAIRDEILWLRAAGHEVRLFTYVCEFDDIPYTRADNEAQIALDPYFQTCTLAVFHFGVYSALFNVLPVAPRGARRLVVFHNITPKQFLPESAHALIDQSFAQLSNMAFADHVVCDSATNRDVLRDAGIEVPTTVLPLAIHADLQAPAHKPGVADQVLRIAFVGRLVQSKAPLHVLGVTERLLAARPALHVQLDMVANLHFSDPLVTASVEQARAGLERRFGARVRATVHGNASEERKQQVLADADLFVLPTYHEGFCVPILEALASGCRVICYDNSNTPSISGGLATLVPTGDVTALEGALAADADLVSSPAWHQGGYRDFTEQAARHVHTFSVDNVRARLLTLVRRQCDARH